MSSVSDVLRDSVFLMHVLMKGRVVAVVSVSSLDVIENIVKQRLSKGLYLLSGRITIDSQEISVRILVHDGQVVEVLVERGENVARGLDELKKLIENTKNLRLHAFEIPSDLMDLYPLLNVVEIRKEETIESKRGVESKEIETPSSVPSTTSKAVTQVAEDKAAGVKKLLEEAKKEAIIAVVEPIEQGVVRVLNALNVDVYSFSIGEHKDRLLVKLIASSYRREITYDTLVWIVVGRLMELDMQRVMSKKVVLELDYNGKQKRTVLDTELAKWLAYFNGTVLKILLPHSFYVDNAKPNISPDGTFVELIYSVKSSVEKYASRAMLSRLAYECVREIKKLWPHKVRVRLRAGLLTEGRAEA